jgi:hypothetical protein
MGNSLIYVIASILILFWFIGFFVFGATAIIHILLVIAIVVIIIRIIQGNKSKKN